MALTSGWGEWISDTHHGSIRFRKCNDKILKQHIGNLTLKMLD